MKWNELYYYCYSYQLGTIALYASLNRIWSEAATVSLVGQSRWQRCQGSCRTWGCWRSSPMDPSSSEASDAQSTIFLIEILIERWLICGDLCSLDFVPLSFKKEKKVFKFLQRVKLKCQTCADSMVWNFGPYQQAQISPKIFRIFSFFCEFSQILLKFNQPI